MSTPARAGPATRASCWMEVCRAMAAVTSCSSTSIGRAARRAGQSIPWNPAPAAGADEQGPDGGVGQRGVDHQSAHGGGHGHLGQHQDLLPVHGVGQRAAPEGPGQQREQLGQTDQPDHQGRVGQRVRLERHGHQGQLGAQTRDHLAGPETPEVPVAPQRGDVDDEPGHPSTVTALIRGPALAASPPPWRPAGGGRVVGVRRAAAGCRNQKSFELVPLIGSLAATGRLHL